MWEGAIRLWQDTEDGLVVCPRCSSAVFTGRSSPISDLLVYLLWPISETHLALGWHYRLWIWRQNCDQDTDWSSVQDVALQCSLGDLHLVVVSCLLALANMGNTPCIGMTHPTVNLEAELWTGHGLFVCPRCCFAVFTGRSSPSSGVLVCLLWPIWETHLALGSCKLCCNTQLLLLGRAKSKDIWNFVLLLTGWPMDTHNFQ